MEYENLSNRELLERLLGARETERLYEGSLRPLFVNARQGGRTHQRLAVAHELVRRLMCEELAQTPILTDPSATKNYLVAYFASMACETFVGLFLDTRHRLIAVDELSKGTISEAAVYPREVVKATLQHHAAAVIFAHNHPSGSDEPSWADRALTRRLKDALALIDVRVLDHFVIGGTSATSFAERGWL